MSRCIAFFMKDKVDCNVYDIKFVTIEDTRFVAFGFEITE